MDFKKAFCDSFAESGLSEEELAVAVGVRVSAIYRYKSGERRATGDIEQRLRIHLPGFATRRDAVPA